MKRKDLYNYIREEIINELSTNEAIQNATIDYKDKNQPDKILKVDDSDQSTIKAIQNDPLVANATIGKKVIKKGTANESELEEMSRKAGAFTIGDTSKFAEAKDLYSAGLYADVLKAIEEAGDLGITQKDLGAKLGKQGSVLNAILNDFKAVGVLGGGNLGAAPKPEKPTKAAPEVKPEFEPEAEKTDDETTFEKEPVIVPKATGNLEKWIDTLADLNTKKDDLVKKLKSKEITLDQYKEMIGNIPSQIKALQAKIDKFSE